MFGRLGLGLGLHGGGGVRRLPPVFDFGGGIMPTGASLARSTGATYFDDSGVLRSVGANVPRFTGGGILIEPARTNKCTNVNVSPNGLLTNVSKSGGGPSTILTVVDDSDALAAEGFNIGNGNAFFIDNRGETAQANVTVYGDPGNTNQHTISIVGRRVGVNSTLSRIRLSSGTVGSVAVNTTAYQRNSFTLSPINGMALFTLDIAGGAAVYFILNQLEEGAYASTPIIVSGASATRSADALALNWAKRGVADGSIDVRYTFGDASAQDATMTVAGGLATVPTSLNRSILKRVELIA